ncbi:hypothetical protein Tco_0413867 [Tanacetum coccineum]
MADDYPLGNLTFVNKGGLDEVFRMPIPNVLITDAIRNSEYYLKYLEMAARKPRQSTTTTVKRLRRRRNLRKLRFDHLVDEADKEPQPAPEPQVENDEYNLQRGIQMSLESLQAQGQVGQAPIGGVVVRKPDPGLIRKLLKVEGKGKGIDDTSANVVHDTSSPADSTNVANMEQSISETDTKILNVEEVQGEEVSNMMVLEERIVELDEGQAGSDPVKTPESRPPAERVLIEEDQAGSNPGQIHQNLKLTTEEQVHIENPLSSSGTLSSMKNLDDAFTFGDQFLNDKSSEEEPRKANVETEVESMVIVLIYQALSSLPLVSTPIIDLSPP